jgi:hypothetical protein
MHFEKIAIGFELIEIVYTFWIVALERYFPHSPSPPNPASLL